MALLATVCPWCRERVRPPEPTAPCPACGRPLWSNGAAVRPVDVRGEDVLAFQEARFRDVLRAGTAVAAVLSVALHVLHLGAAALAPLLAGLHLLVVRLLLIRRGYVLLGPTRRRFNRWILRLGFLWLGVPGWGMAAVPVAGLLAPPAVFVGLTALAHFYTASSLRREKERLPLYAWEKIVLFALATLTLAALVLAAVFAGLVWVVARQLVKLPAGG